MSIQKTELLTDVWRFETPIQEQAINEMQYIIDDAMAGGRKSQNYLKKLWEGESWQRIKEKLMTEGSCWYVWFMDGVNQHIKINF